VSEQNVQLTRRAYELFNARDVEAFIALCNPEIELNSTFAAVGGATYHGHDGIRRWFADLEDAWGDELRAEVETYFDLGENTLTFMALHGRGQQSGVDVAMPATQVIGWRDGLLIYFKAYIHREDALSDLGITEDALQPIAP
jgi:ketosteroid isomerase-like protein